MQLSVPELTTFLVYFVVLIVIGIWVYRRTQTLGDFLLGGRGLNTPTAALSAQASDMSGWLLLGLPGAVYVSGLGATWIAIGLAVGTYLNWKLVAPRLRTYTERANDALTLSAYFDDRFEDRTRLLRLASALVIVIFFSVYVSAQLVAGGILFEEVFGADVTFAITVAALAIVAYAFLGGFLAVSLTDAIQGSLMWIALIALPLVAIGIVGGVTALTADLERESGALLAMNAEAELVGDSWVLGERLGIVAVVSGLAWGLGYFGQPHILARFMGIRSAAMIKPARRIGVTWVVTTLAGACLVGLVGIVYFTEPLGNPETVFIALIQDLLNPWVGGILLAAVLAAAMSTADSQLLVSSSALTEDLYRAFLRRDATQTELVWAGRATVVLVAVIAYGLALQGGGVLEIVEFAWAGFGAAFGPLIIASLFWPRMTAVGAGAGMVVGALTVVLWAQFDPFGWGLYELLPGFVAGAIAIVVFNPLGRPPERAWVGASGQEELAARPA
jgi:sodium/proline symporter